MQKTKIYLQIKRIFNVGVSCLLPLVLLVHLFAACSAKKALIKSKNKAISYLENAEISYDHVFLYSYLRPIYNLPDIHFESKFKLYLDSLEKNKDEISQKKSEMIYSYRKFFDKHHIIEKEKIENAEDLNFILLTALYCDKYPIDTTTYFSELVKVSKNGEYALSHALLCLYVIKNNNCHDLVNQQLLLSNLIEDNVKMIESSCFYWNDINIESSAILQASGYKFPKRRIKEIIRLQQKDGGWKSDPAASGSNAHTTVLALWAILAFNDRLN